MLTIPRITARNRYWRAFPPAHLLLKAIATWAGALKPHDFDVPDQPRASGPSGLAELRAMFPGGIRASDLSG